MTLLQEIIALGVGDRFSNPFAPDANDLGDAGKRALHSGSACILCAYCSSAIAHPTKRTLPKLLRLAEAQGAEALPKAVALKLVGFPDTCYNCACNPCADVDQRKIRQMIEAP